MEAPLSMDIDHNPERPPALYQGFGVARRARASTIANHRAAAFTVRVVLDVPVASLDRPRQLPSRSDRWKRRGVETRKR